VQSSQLVVCMVYFVYHVPKCFTYMEVENDEKFVIKVCLVLSFNLKLIYYCLKVIKQLNICCKIIVFTNKMFYSSL
jgi:hypothetical protein